MYQAARPGREGAVAGTINALSKTNHGEITLELFAAAGGREETIFFFAHAVRARSSDGHQSSI